MNPAFYISPSGIVKYIENLPEEPKLCFYFNPNHTFHPHCEHSYNVPCACNEQYSLYLKALQAAKDSAVECADQNQVKQILFERFCIFPKEYQDRLDTIHPFPLDQYEVEVREDLDFEKDCDTDSFFNKKKVAVITPKEERMTPTEDYHKMQSCEYYQSDSCDCLTECSFEQKKEPNQEESQEELPLNFWKRLYAFVENVEVNDLPGDEEKEMILSVAKRFIITPREQNGKG